MARTDGEGGEGGGGGHGEGGGGGERGEGAAVRNASVATVRVGCDVTDCAAVSLFGKSPYEVGTDAAVCRLHKRFRVPR